MPIARCELLDATMMRAVNAHSDLGRPEAPTLFLEFHGSPAGVEEDARYVEELAHEHGGGDFAWATRRRTARGCGAPATTPTSRASDCARAAAPSRPTSACPVSELAATIDATIADVADLPFPAPLLGHVADGNFHVMLLIDPDDPEDRSAAEAVYERMVDRAIAVGGTCTGEHGVGLGKRRALGAQSGEAVEVMRALKLALDPSDCLNPGKVSCGSASALQHVGPRRRADHRVAAVADAPRRALGLARALAQPCRPVRSTTCPSARSRPRASRSADGGLTPSSATR